MECPCGSGKKLTFCCQPIINGTQIAVSAEELMRSRYTAYTFANVDYLLKSHHLSTRPTKERKEILRWAKSVKWLGLSILNTQHSSSDKDEGFVEFRAMYTLNGQLQQIHENSLFKKVKGIWYYVAEKHY